MNALHLLFMGSPEFALPALEQLHESPHQLKAVVTRPDRPRGRGGRIGFTPVKEWALRRALEVLQPRNMKEEGFRRRLAEINPDLIVTAAYGRILPREILKLPPLGCINLHASLLPDYRGAAPIHRAIMDGALQSGVTVLYMVEQLDAGEIILQEPEAISIADTAGTLHDRLAIKGGRLLRRAVDLLARGEASPVAQDPAAATYAPPLHPGEERLDWNRGALALYNQIRGMNPWPGAYTTCAGQRLKVWRAAPPRGSGGTAGAGQPGTVLAVSGEALVVAAGDGPLELLEVQPAGKRPMSAADYCRGYRLASGDRLE